MKRNIRLFVIIVFSFSTILLTGCGDDSGSSGGGTVQNAVYLAGEVFYHQPIHGARINIYNLQNQLIESIPNATSVSGCFLFRNIHNLPDEFIIEAEGGSLVDEKTGEILEPFAGKLAAFVDHYHPFQTVSENWISIHPVTQLVVRHLERNPFLSHLEVKQQVREFLSIPEHSTINIYRDIDLTKWFSMDRLAQEHEEAFATLSEYIEYLLDLLDAGEKKKFYEQEPQEVEAAGFAGLLAKGLLGGLSRGVLSGFVSKGISALFGLMGMGSQDKTSEELEKINQQLEDIKSTLKDIQKQLNDIKDDIVRMGDEIKKAIIQGILSDPLSTLDAAWECYTATAKQAAGWTTTEQFKANKDFIDKQIEELRSYDYHKSFDQIRALVTFKGTADENSYLLTSLKCFLVDGETFSYDSVNHYTLAVENVGLAQGYLYEKLQQCFSYIVRKMLMGLSVYLALDVHDLTGSSLESALEVHRSYYRDAIMPQLADFMRCVEAISMLSPTYHFDHNVQDDGSEQLPDFLPSTHVRTRANGFYSEVLGQQKVFVAEFIIPYDERPNFKEQKGDWYAHRNDLVMAWSIEPSYRSYTTQVKAPFEAFYVPNLVFRATPGKVNEDVVKPKMQIHYNNEWRLETYTPRVVFRMIIPEKDWKEMPDTFVLKAFIQNARWSSDYLQAFGGESPLSINNGDFFQGTMLQTDPSRHGTILGFGIQRWVYLFPAQVCTLGYGGSECKNLSLKPYWEVFDAPYPLRHAGMNFNKTLDYCIDSRDFEYGLVDHFNNGPATQLKQDNPYAWAVVLNDSIKDQNGDLAGCGLQVRFKGCSFDLMERYDVNTKSADLGSLLNKKHWVGETKANIFGKEIGTGSNITASWVTGYTSVETAWWVIRQ